MIEDSHASAELIEGRVSFTHRCTFDREVIATLPAGKEGWQVTCEDPLTVNPSVICEACGWHGWILGGKCIK